LKLKDRLPQAIAQFRRATELDPQSADSYYTLGVTLWQQGQFDEAAECLRNAIRVKPDYTEAYYTLGSVLKQQGKLPEAAAALREAIRLEPDFAGAHTNLAGVLCQTGDTEAAAQESRKANELMKQQTNRQAATLALRSGQRLLNAGDLDGAISQFQVAIAETPDNAMAHYQLAIAFKRKGDQPAANEEFAKAHQLDARLVP
jgi:protein O-GlcNAc transferase